MPLENCEKSFIAQVPSNIQGHVLEILDACKLVISMSKSRKPAQYTCFGELLCLAAAVDPLRIEIPQAKSSCHNIDEVLVDPSTKV